VIFYRCVWGLSGLENRPTILKSSRVNLPLSTVCWWAVCRFTGLVFSWLSGWSWVWCWWGCSIHDKSVTVMLRFVFVCYQSL